MVIPSGDNSNRPEAPTFGSFRYNTELGTLEFFNGTVFKPVGIAGEVDIIVDSFTGDGSTLTFGPLSDSVTDSEQVIVFVGSIYQQPTTYSITGGSNDEITFTGAPPSGSPINVILNLASTVAS